MKEPEMNCPKCESQMTIIQIDHGHELTYFECPHCNQQYVLENDKLEAVTITDSSQSKIVQFPSKYIAEIQAHENVSYTLSAKIEILRGFDDMKDLSEQELQIEAEKAPEDMLFYFMQTYQSMGVTTYVEFAKRMQNIFLEALARKTKQMINPFNWFKKQ